MRESRVFSNPVTYDVSVYVATRLILYTIGGTSSSDGSNIGIIGGIIGGIVAVIIMIIIMIIVCIVVCCKRKGIHAK